MIYAIFMIINFIILIIKMFWLNIIIVITITAIIVLMCQ